MAKKNLLDEKKEINSSMKDESFPNDNLLKVARFIGMGAFRKGMSSMIKPKVPGLSTIRKGRVATTMSEGVGGLKGQARKDALKQVADTRSALAAKNLEVAGLDPSSLGVRGRYMQNRRMKQLNKITKDLGQPGSVTKVVPKSTTPVPDITGKGKKTKKYFTKRQFAKFTVGGGGLLGAGYLAGLGSGKSKQKYNKYY